MPVVGFNFKKILSEKKNPIRGKLKINNNLKIVSIDQETETISKSDELLKFEFMFSINYDPEVGYTEIEGNLVYMDEPDKIKQILNDWKKDKKLSKEISTVVFNTILARTNIKALTLAQDVNLPPHFRLPLIKPN